MTPALFALLATLIAGIGARDQMLVAGLVRANVRGADGRGWPLYVTAALTAALACGVAAWGAQTLAAGLPRAARLLVAAFALLLAGGESLLLTPRRAPAEPTHSLGAAALVLLASQITDAARFLVLAIAEASSAPIPSAAGGIAVSCLALALAFGEPGALLAQANRLQTARRLAGAVLLLAGVALVIWIWSVSPTD